MRSKNLLVPEKIHPDFLRLLQRYKTDKRFKSSKEKQECMKLLLELNDWAQSVEKPPKLISLMLYGSFSSYGEVPPRPQPYKNAPKFNGKRERGSGSDIDILCFYKTSVLNWLLLQLSEFDLDFDELVHPKNFLYNTGRYLQESLRNDPRYKNVAQRAEINVIPFIPGIGGVTSEIAFYNTILSTGTLLWGRSPSRKYGKTRDNPRSFIPRSSEHPSLGGPF